MSAPRTVVPSACRWCAVERRGHGRQFADAVGWHEWAAPSQEQILARMKARRLALTVAREGALPMPVGTAEAAPDGITRLFAPTQALRVDADRIVAHRAPDVSVIYCTICCRGNDQLDALTSADLPDGGVCVSCDRDVLLMAEQGGA
ncbi:hypothetical protein [Streptomyces sp. NPDC005302]|uniref:hypothetical protein n=1 Tax=Streptomyces sp. NPDC005302 TaxID=3154675 RepID=UPI0033AB3291